MATQPLSAGLALADCPERIPFLRAHASAGLSGRDPDANRHTPVLAARASQRRSLRDLSGVVGTALSDGWLKAMPRRPLPWLLALAVLAPLWSAVVPLLWSVLINLLVVTPFAIWLAVKWCDLQVVATAVSSLERELQTERRLRRHLKTEMICLRAQRSAVQIRDQAELTRLHGALQESYRRLTLALSSAGIGYFEIEASTERMTFSRRVATTLRMPAHELPDTRADWLERVHEDDRHLFESPNSRGELTRSKRLDYRVRRGDGQFVWVRDSLIAASSDTRLPTRLVGTLTDISAQKRMEEKLEERAYRDHLTGLGNRAAFDRALASALTGVGDNSLLGLIFVDLDHFKAVNDRGGHPAGDAWLVEAARRLKNAVGESDQVLRLGGDEFAVVAVDRNAVVGFEAIAKRIEQGLRDPFRFEGQPYRVSASVGLAVIDRPVTQSEVVARADEALYAAKSAGRSRWVSWNSATDGKLTFARQRTANA